MYCHSTGKQSWGVIKSGCGLSSWKWGQECPQNPQAGKPALRVAQTFLSAGSGDFPVACPSPTFNHTPASQRRQIQLGDDASAKAYLASGKAPMMNLCI